ncbi:hypothetical protein ABZP36_033001 [Zizania latifolia]
MVGAAPVVAFVLLAITRGAAAQSPGPADEPLSFADLAHSPVAGRGRGVIRALGGRWLRLRTRGQRTHEERRARADRRHGVTHIHFLPRVHRGPLVHLPPLFRSPDDELPLVDTSSSEGPRRLSKAGLDAAEIAALPLETGHGRDDALDCAVCLLEFDDDDALCLLPTCPHAFHPECIGLCSRCTSHSRSAAPTSSTRCHPRRLWCRRRRHHRTHETVVLIGDASANEEADERIRIQGLARKRRAAGRQALPRSNSTGHARGGGMERFALRLPEHVRLEILMSHRLRHVTTAVVPLR